jgi:hypothetical protein
MNNWLDKLLKKLERITERKPGNAGLLKKGLLPEKEFSHCP